MTPEPNYINVYSLLERNAVNEGKWLRTCPPEQRAYWFVHISAMYLAPDADQATALAQLQAIARYHIQKNWAKAGDPPAYGWCAMYHWAIDTMGRIYVLNPMTHILWNTTDGNPWGAATVLLLGEDQEPTAAMLATLEQHLNYQTEYGHTRATAHSTFGHGECGLVYGGGPAFRNNTKCPGKALPWVRDYRKGAVVPLPPSNVRQFPSEVGGQQIHDGFKDAWEALEKLPATDGVSGNMALQVVGYPIGPEVQEKLSDGNTYTVQYFERSRAEWHIVNGVGRVLWGRVGAELVVARTGSGHDCACEAPGA